MLKDKVRDAINTQINREIYSAYLYLSMSAFFSDINMPGFAGWMKVQVQEELSHADKMYNFVIERGGRVTLGAVEAPPTEWSSPLNTFEATLEHEQAVTGMINALVDIASAEKDHATGNFLQWFVDEQVEEEASADAVIQQLKLAGDAPGALFMLDRELGQRVFTPPAV